MKPHTKPRGLRRFFRAEEAVSALEYAIVVGVVSVGVATAVGLFADDIGTALETIGQDLADIEGGGTPELE